MGTATIDIYDPDWYVDGDFHATFAELRAQRSGALAGHARRARLLGRHAPPGRRDRRPQPRGLLGVARRGGARGPRTGATRGHAADDARHGSAAPHALPASTRPALHPERDRHDGAADPGDLPRHPRARRRQGRGRLHQRGRRAAAGAGDRPGHGPAARGHRQAAALGRGAGQRPGRRGHRRLRHQRRQHGDGDVRDRPRRRAAAAAADRRHLRPAARHRVRGRPADGRHRARQLLRAARHRRQRHDEDDDVDRPVPAADPSRSAAGAARRPVADAGRGRGDAALLQSVALLPAHRDTRRRARRQADQGRRQGGDDVHLGQPRRRRCSPTPRRSTPPAPRTRTSRSASAATSASACTSPGWRRGSSSRSSSTRSPRSSCATRRCASAATSTTATSGCRCASPADRRPTRARRSAARPAGRR